MLKTLRVVGSIGFISLLITGAWFAYTIHRDRQLDELSLMSENTLKSDKSGDTSSLWEVNTKRATLSSPTINIHIRDQVGVTSKSGWTLEVKGDGSFICGSEPYFLSSEERKQWFLDVERDGNNDKNKQTEKAQTQQDSDDVVYTFYAKPHRFIAQSTNASSIKVRITRKGSRIGWSNWSDSIELLEPNGEYDVYFFSHD